jgi:hypothetical protein
MHTRDVQRRAKQRQPKGLVPLSEAVLIACFQTGMSGAVSQMQADAMAGTLARLCTLYQPSEDRIHVRALRAEDMTGGRLVERGRCMVFTDERRLERLMVTRTALRAAIATMKRGALKS